MLVVAPVFRFFACVLALFAVSFPAEAQEATPTPTPLPPLQMALSSPFLTPAPLKLTVRQNRWFPIAVTLSNSGDPVSGTVRLRLTSGSSFDSAPNDFYCPVDLPTNARKVVWLYGRLERPQVAGVTVSLEGRGFTTLSQNVPLEEAEPTQRLVLTVSDTDLGLSSTLRALRGPGLAATPARPANSSYPGNSTFPGSSGFPGAAPGSSQGPIRPLETSRAGVPDRWFGLETADLVVLGDFPPSALLPPQVEALRGYVAGGGTLLALGGSNAARLSGSPLADLWPSAVTTSNAAGAGEVAAVVKRYVETARNGADRLGGAPVVIARGALKPGATLSLGSAAAPLVSSLDVGAGRVVLLGFDPSQPPFVGWSGQSELWRSIFNVTSPTRHLEGTDADFVSNNPNFNSSSYSGYGYRYRNGYGAPPPETESSSATGQLLRTVAKAPQLAMPPVSQIAWFLALYVFVLVPLNYAVLRFIDRRELAWVTIPVIVGAFSVFAYSAALSIRGSAILTRQIDIVQGTLGSPLARADSLLWLFSPKRTTYDVHSSQPSAAVADYSNEAGTKQGNFSILQPGEASSFKVEGANVWMWADRAFFAQSLLDLKGGLSVKGSQITNDTPFDLSGVVWVQDFGVRTIGALRAGATAPIPGAVTEKALNVDLLSAIQRASGIDELVSSDTASNGIPNSALQAALGPNFGQQNAGSVCIAWAKTPLAPLSIGASGARSSDLTLLVFRVPKTLAPPRLATREAVVTRVASEPSSASPLSLPGRPSGMGGNVESFDCLLPASRRWVLAARGTGATASDEPFAPPMPRMNPSRAQPLRVRFEVFNASQNRWTPLAGQFKLDGSAIGGWNFSAPINAAWVRQPDRFLRVRVHCGTVQTRVSTLAVRLQDG